MAPAHGGQPLMRIALTRVLVSVFWLATATYALLSAIPFASKQFLEPRLVPAIAAFAVWHLWISVGALAATAVGLAPWLRGRHRGVCTLIAGWAAVAAFEFAIAPLSALQPSTLALALSLAALLPPVGLALIDMSPTVRDWPANGETRASGDFIACASAALVVTLGHALRILLAGGSPTPQKIADFCRAAVLHLVVFSAIFAVISVIRGAARLTRRPAVVEAWLGRAFLAAVLAIVVDRIVLSSLSFNGGGAAAMAAGFGLALAVILGPRGTRAPGGVETALGGFVPHWASRSPAFAGLWLFFAMGTAAAGEAAMAGSDWNFTVGKLIAFASWLVALATTLRVAPRQVGRAAALRPIAALAPFGACALVLVIHVVALPAVTAAAKSGASVSAAGDVSSRLIVDALTPTAPTDSGLYEYLQRYTNIPRSEAVQPVSVDFGAIARSPVRPPHIFLLVVDSLRRDYLSPYNQAVRFTPAIGRFAAESTVFQRAFTRYGGTGLAVPSIWTGGLLLHKQYVTPFAPMNTLSKLLAAKDYSQSISMEHIVETVVPADAAIEPLDVGVPVKDQRLCRTLLEVRGRLDRLAGSNHPAFVYSLPQDIHVSTIAREGAAPVDAQDYGGFNPAYASRVRRMDACFGEFVEDLKMRGLYEQSIIILTSDHGDSLGEDGRMGHAYTIFPEVIQVPLLVHLPERLRPVVTAEPAALAFTTDISPTLFALLGHEPVRPARIFGQPLFHAASAVPADRQKAEVVASSYGSVYGALLDDGRSLYIIDAVSLKDYVYQLDGSAAGRAVPVTEANRQAGQSAVRATIDEISRFYAYWPPADSR